jgi:single-strand DNA-binding protein
VNFINIAGHLGADPEVRFTPSGQKVTTLRLAAKVRRSKKDETIWWRVTIWGEQFDKMMPHIKKGSAIMAFGEMNKPEIFTDRDGKPQISMGMTAIQISFSPFGRSDRQQETNSGSSQYQAGSSANTNTNNTNQDYSGMATGSKNVDANQALNSEFFNKDEDIPF